MWCAISMRSLSTPSLSQSNSFSRKRRRTRLRWFTTMYIPSCHHILRHYCNGVTTLGGRSRNFNRVGPAAIFFKKGGPTTFSGQFVLKSLQKGGSGPPGSAPAAYLEGTLCLDVPESGGNLSLSSGFTSKRFSMRPTRWFTLGWWLLLSRAIFHQRQVKTNNISAAHYISPLQLLFVA